MCYIKGGTPKGSAKRDMMDASETKATQLSPDRFRSMVRFILPVNLDRGETAASLLFAKTQNKAQLLVGCT
jgi:hypothetical protein